MKRSHGGLRSGRTDKTGFGPSFFIARSSVKGHLPFKAAICPAIRFYAFCGQFLKKNRKIALSGKIRSHRGIPGNRFMSIYKKSRGVRFPALTDHISMMSLSGSAAASAASFSRSSCFCTCGASATLFASLMANQFFATKIAMLAGVFPVSA